MSAVSDARHLTARDLEPILAVAAKLAAPFDLTTMLSEVMEAARDVLEAERCAVWLYERETDELVLRLASDLSDLRIPADKGLAGACARGQRIINVPDCYADSRFDSSIDLKSGFRTRCMLALPLVGHNGDLVGVMQVLNRRGGIFDEFDERLAAALAAQCAVALQRVRMTEALIESEKMRQELEMARVVQTSSLPSRMPEIPGYDAFGTTKPAEETGGDTFDLTTAGERVLMVLADATGHGIAPALSVTEMQAMLRMGFRLGADLEHAFVEANNLLVEALPDDRFITAFIGLLDPKRHQVKFQSAGQAPILHYRAATRECVMSGPTGAPLSVIELQGKPLKPSVVTDLEPGDVLALISDGFYEYADETGELFGESRVQSVVAAHAGGSMQHLCEQLFFAVKAFAGKAPQEDDMTVVLVKRIGPCAQATFRRSLDALDEIFAFTSEVFPREGLPEDLRGPVDFVLEELFTNVVKYGRRSMAAVHVEVTKIPDGVEVTLAEDDALRFDPTFDGPDVDVTLPIGARTPGGLGLHLIKKLVDSVEYRYDEVRQQGRTTFRKVLPEKEKGGS